ncbi:hypothetical protein QAD02_008626 [Eretmocerus hayati]|uniref:Uncharacterized protein n=1 Tax=Eretmocerus hayati TaxID=131215 RepID=A0ACC2N9G0_9HYME|nr:hypothetical protein QAD02_008626 [Eretmocerus hayati]
MIRLRGTGKGTILSRISSERKLETVSFVKWDKKLSRKNIVSEFAQALGTAMEGHGQTVIRLVDDFRNRSSETRSDASSMRRLWDSLLRQVEADASAQLELASLLQQQLSRPALEGCFHRKVQHRKIFSQREAYEQVVAKSEDKLNRTRAEYKRAYGALLSTPEANQDSELKRAYLEAHNAYVLQLHATNAIAERYQFQCLPELLGEVANVYEELCVLECRCVAGISEAAGERVAEQTKRYHLLAKEVRTVNAQSDLQILARSLSTVAQPRKPPRRLFVPPTPPEQTSGERPGGIPTLRDELVPTGSHDLSIIEDDLCHEADKLAATIANLQDALEALNRMQRKSAEGNLYTKVAELQEDISMKTFDLGVAQLQLAAVHAQRDQRENCKGRVGRVEDTIEIAISSSVHYQPTGYVTPGGGQPTRKMSTVA